MHDDGLSIPEFLKIPQAERDAAWKANPPRRMSKAAARRDWSRPKTWTPEAAALEKARDKEAAEAAKARFKALREKKGK